VRCATHPEIETELRCATCGIPICPDCLVETPVGMKCREHGLAPTPPHHRVSAIGYALAIPAGFVLAAIGGFIALNVPFLFVPIFLGAIGGGVIGEAMSFCTGWKRGPRLAAVAAATVLLGGASAPALLLLLRGNLILLGELWRALVALELQPLLFSGLAAATAYWRIR